MTENASSTCGHEAADPWWSLPEQEEVTLEAGAVGLLPPGLPPGQRLLPPGTREDVGNTGRPLQWDVPVVAALTCGFSVCFLRRVGSVRLWSLISCDSKVSFSEHTATDDRARARLSGTFGLQLVI